MFSKINIQSHLENKILKNCCTHSCDDDTQMYEWIFKSSLFDLDHNFDFHISIYTLQLVNILFAMPWDLEQDTLWFSTATYTIWYYCSCKNHGCHPSQFCTYCPVYGWFFIMCPVVPIWGPFVPISKNSYRFFWECPGS